MRCAACCIRPARSTDLLPEKRMKISIASYSVHGLLAEGKIDVYGYLESCRYRYGLDTADFWNGLIGTTDTDAIHRVRQGVEERELTVVNYHVDGVHLWEDDP